MEELSCCLPKVRDVLHAGGFAAARLSTSCYESSDRYHGHENSEDRNHLFSGVEFVLEHH